MTNTITIKALTSDLNGAAEAAAEHFRQVGVSRGTVQTFVLNCREAGLKVGRQGNTLILAH
ncbi:MAG: hypothetical protein AB7W59_23490 [Acidimicrobiia bacterium]